MKNVKAISILADLVMELAERVAKNNEDMWDQVFEIAGADRSTENCKVKWITREIEVTSADMEWEIQKHATTSTSKKRDA